MNKTEAQEILKDLDAKSIEALQETPPRFTDTVRARVFNCGHITMLTHQEASVTIRLRDMFEAAHTLKIEAFKNIGRGGILTVDHSACLPPYDATCGSCWWYKLAPEQSENAGYCYYSPEYDGMHTLTHKACHNWCLKPNEKDDE